MTDTNRPEDTSPDEQPLSGRSAQPGAGVPAKPGSTQQEHGPEELPYIDDPVTKWWIAIIVAVFVVIFAWAIFFGAGGLFDGILDSEDPTPSPEPTLIATPETTAVPTDAPGITPEAAATGTPEPTADSQPSEAPTSAPTPEPTPTATPAASDEPVASPGS